MAATLSNMMQLGTLAPDFSLLDTKSNKVLGLQNLRGSKATVVMFICNHCPFVKHVNSELIKIANEYQGKGVGFVAISSNDIESYPEDGPEQMKIVAEKLHYPFPYLFDETQEVARSYDAACTPDFYIFDKNLACAYRGQLDDSRPGNNISVTGKDLRQALDDIIAQQPVTINQKPSMGCNIKWKN